MFIRGRFSVLRTALRPHLFLDPLDMAAAEGLHLAAQLEVAADGVVAEDAEAVDYRQRPARPSDNLVRLQVQILLVGHRQEDRLGPLEAPPASPSARECP